jgi:hypothetical protein
VASTTRAVGVLGSKSVRGDQGLCIPAGGVTDDTLLRISMALENTAGGD